MSLSHETLRPLTYSTVPFEYCDDRKLWSLATRFVPTSADDGQGKTTCSLLLCAGISLQKEAWLPVIKRLYKLASQANSRVYIHSVWVIERPNHGDAALLNEVQLREHYRVMFPSRQYATAIRAFLASDHLSERERANLIAVGHSGGGGAIIEAIEPAKLNLPVSRLILAEAPHIGQECWTPMKQIYQSVKASNARRRTNWASVDEAMSYFKQRLPCKAYHPEVWQIMKETYFREDPQDPRRVTTKTTVEQETACFLDDGTHLATLGYLRSMYQILPTHLILGTEEDIWLPEIYRHQRENVKRDHNDVASVSYIEGAGHYLPFQMPEELAVEIARLLNDYGGSHAGARL